MEFPKRLYAVMRPGECISVAEMKEFTDAEIALEDGEDIAVFVLDAIGKIRLGPAVTFPGNEVKPKTRKPGRPKGATNKPKTAQDVPAVKGEAE